MGMDVYGKNPKSEVGEYFRNNVWYWRPLWGYVCDRFSDLAGPEPEHGFYNDGYGLDGEAAATLGAALLADIESGVVEQFRYDYYKELAELPRQDCRWCGASGIRSDEVGVRGGMPDKALDVEIAILVGRTYGWCNGCNGVGTTEHFAYNYPFEVDNVREFAEFLIESGGFAIC